MPTIRDEGLSTEPEPSRPLPPTPFLVRFAGWCALAVAVVLGVMVWQLLSLRSDVKDLRTQVRATAARSAGSGPSTPLTVPVRPAPPIDRPPRDAESARRAITDTDREVFSRSTTPARWAALVLEPGDLGARLAALTSGRCGGATAVLTDIRFTDDDSALVTFRFEGSGVPAGDTTSFTGSASRTPDGWKAATDGITAVVDAAGSFCGAN